MLPNERTMLVLAWAGGSGGGGSGLAADEVASGGGGGGAAGGFAVASFTRCSDVDATLTGFATAGAGGSAGPAVASGGDGGPGSNTTIELGGATLTVFAGLGGSGGSPGMPGPGGLAPPPAVAASSAQLLVRIEYNALNSGSVGGVAGGEGGGPGFPFAVFSPGPQPSDGNATPGVNGLQFGNGIGGSGASQDLSGSAAAGGAGADGLIQLVFGP